MPVKRTDHKGRRLREGESQRKNLLYQYRYTDENGKRCTVYASDLKELREKEAAIQITAVQRIVITEALPVMATQPMDSP